MFDHKHTHHTYATTTVTENRAPTDESVRILRDMEDRAEKRVLAAVRVDNTLVDMVIHKRDDCMSGDRLYTCIFKVNGKQMKANRDDAKRMDVAIGIRDAVAQEIASAICSEAMRAAFNKFDFNH